MLATTIPSYLYTQYADDADCQAFVDQYNLATQNYVDWFNNVGLAYYPGLTGPLLDWVGQGVYGIARTTLESPTSPAVGPLNTLALNTQVLNYYAAPTTTYYSLSDDAYQRIITWNFFKGDGKRFCMRWLKRRIMRFLVGTNGIDPEPWNAGFVVGAENTSAISVGVVRSGLLYTLTVTINQTILSNLVQIAPGILAIFQAAFLGGTLDLPVQYQYAVVITSGVVASISVPSVSNAGPDMILNTVPVVVSATGGSSPYTYAWAFSSGGSGITINSPSAAVTTFTATGLTLFETVTGVAACTVTDAFSTTSVANVSVTLTRLPGAFSTIVIDSTPVNSGGVNE